MASADSGRPAPRRAYPMPFGAALTADGEVRFRLWAPAARMAELGLERGGGERVLPMMARDGGWFELTTDEAKPGSRYRFRVDCGLWVPDPASRFNPQDVHGPSEVIDPAAYHWNDGGWRGRPWEEAVFYELHVGAFTPQGSFRAVIDRLDYLKDLGVSAVELMPVADFPGRRDWGYDGVLAFAPDAAYGRPEDLKALVDAAHARGLMVFLDVVYNHFGPEGNYLHVYAKAFFTERHHTPWGAAINFDDAGSRTVRDFFIHNALYWLTEFHIDGLRLDAVHAILDDSDRHILEELAEAVADGPGRDRQVHLVLENDANQAHFLARDGERPRWYAAQWNDDIHHAFHVLLTGESDGYYADYADAPLRHLGRCLVEGFAWQGEASPFRHGERRGEPSRDLPCSAFVAFLQNHDQIGNRAFGERLTRLARPEALRAAAAVMLLAPTPPLLFMGEEFGAETPFLFFCDFGPDLRTAVREGRRKEFARFSRFADPAVRERIPDPGAEETFAASRLDWSCLEHAPHHDWLGFYRSLLALRREQIIPRLHGARGLGSSVREDGALTAAWHLGDGGTLHLLANLGVRPLSDVAVPEGRAFYRLPADLGIRQGRVTLPPWSLVWLMQAREVGNP